MKTHLEAMRDFAATLPKDLGPMFGRDVVRLIEAYEQIVGAAQELDDATLDGPPYSTNRAIRVRNARDRMHQVLVNLPARESKEDLCQ